MQAIFCTKSSKYGVCFALTAPLIPDESHLKGPIVTHGHWPPDRTAQGCPGPGSVACKSGRTWTELGGGQPRPKELGLLGVNSCHDDLMDVLGIPPLPDSAVDFSLR